MIKTLLAFCLLFFPLGALAQPPEEPQLADSKNKSAAIDKDETDILQRHNPFYVAYGHELTKLQLSFRTPLMRKHPLYFGYTQQMFWALSQDSKPFRDLTFNPELFYQYRIPDAGLIKSMDLGFFAHNSNGKDGPASRSYNKSYLRMNVEKELQHWVARFSIQVQDLYGFDPGNMDIQDHIGPLVFNLSFIQLFNGWIDKSEVALMAFPGGKFANHWDYGGYQLSWSFRLGGLQMVPAFYLQYYKGYAETLLNYADRVDVFRAGIIF